MSGLIRRSDMKPLIIFLVSVLCVSSLAAQTESPIRPGDRIAIVGNTFADQIRIHGYLETLLLQWTKENPVSVRNLGWAGDMLTLRDRPTNFATEESTLTDHKTDVIIGCFGLGESFAGEAGLTAFKQDLADFIKKHRGKKYNGKSTVRLVLISPIANEDLGRLSPRLDERNAELEAYTNAMASVAIEQGVPFVDLFTPIKYIMEEPDSPSLTTNGIHLNSYGYWVASRLIFDRLVVAEGETMREQPWRIEIDAKSGTGTAAGLSLEGITVTDREVSFLAHEDYGPTLPPPTTDLLPPQVEEFRDRLTVENLAPGRYTLIIDGVIVASGTPFEWAHGLPIDRSPAHLEAEALREKVNDKNRQFVYSWKAYNQVHIVGERRSSPSGRALPAEVIEFNEITKERDAKLGEAVSLKTREWRLRPITD